MILFRPIVLLLITVLPFVEITGQHSHAIYTRFVNDSITVEPGQTFSNELLVQNTSNSRIVIDSLKPANLLPGILFTPEFSGPVEPNSLQTFKIKMIADIALMRSPIRQIEYCVYFRENSKAKTSKAKFTIVRPAANHLVMGTLSGEAYFNPSASENTICLFVENPGYENKNIVLKYQLLPETYLTTAEQQELVSLGPKERKLVLVRLLTRSKNVYYPDYSLSVIACEPGSLQAISSTIVPVRTLAEKRNMNYSLGAYTHKNYFELQLNRSNRGNEFIQFRSNFEQKLETDKVMEFNATADYFTNQNFLNLYDTWLSFRTSKTISRVGNINAQGYDVNLAGRGALFQYKIASGTHVEILGINNSFLLYSSSRHLTDPGYSIGTKLYQRINDTKIMTTSYVLNKNNFTGIRSQLATVNLPIIADSVHSLAFEGGASLSEGTDQHKKHHGGALGLSYTLTRKQVSFISNNYFSSAYYAGLRKGAFNLYEFFRYQFSDNSSIFLLYSGSTNRPKFIANGPAFLLCQVNNSFITHQLEAGYGKTIKGYTFTLAPNYNFQLYSMPGVMKYEAYRTKLNMAKLYGEHAVNLTIDYGIGRIIDSNKNFPSTRVLLNYRISSFYIDGMASFNPANVYDVTMLRGNDRFRNYSLTTGYNLNQPGSKLSGNVYVGYHYITAYKSRNYFSSALFSYNMGNDWHATGNLTYSSFHNNERGAGFNNLQFSIGLKKNFPQWSSATDNQHNIILEVFEDHDQNGRRNGTEPLLPGTIIQLNKATVAITDSKGKIKLTKVPEANYYITAKKNDIRLDILWGDSIYLNKNKTFAIPVIKTFTRNGHLKEIKAAYDIQVQDASGITIYAQNTQTGKTYTTLTDLEGNFQLRLPAGIYRVYIRHDRYEITNNNQEITVSTLQQDIPLTFLYKNKDVKIHVKQF